MLIPSGFPREGNDSVRTPGGIRMAGCSFVPFILFTLGQKFIDVECRYCKNAQFSKATATALTCGQSKKGLRVPGLGGPRDWHWSPEKPLWESISRPLREKRVGKPIRLRYSFL